MTIGRKILGGYLVLLVLLVIVAVIGIAGLRNIESRYAHFLDVNERLVKSSNMLLYEAANEPRFFRAFLLYDDQREEFWKELQDTYKRFDRIIEEAKGIALTQEGISMLNEIADLDLQGRKLRQQSFDLVQKGKLVEAIALGKTLTELTTRTAASAEQFREREQKLQAEGRTNVVATQRALTILMVIVSSLGLVSGLLIAILLGRVINRQLREATAHLASSSSELSVVATQLASGAAETATAVSETTATVEQVRQATQVNSQKATSVSENAQRATKVTQNGRKAVEDLTRGIVNIQERMSSIAESIVRLSEQSQAIGEIIASVNDLAEQSNLLTVNAAIEAAKAGEQGKGFAVVAQEIKSLAEQSKQATGRVRAILGDIQKSTTAAVMATEQGSKAVEAGVKQSEMADESIRLLAESVAEAAQAATQIAASSHQQMVGMEQVASAMENIKQASSQNVAGAKQVETATHNLQQVGLKLRKAVEGHKAENAHGQERK